VDDLARHGHVVDLGELDPLDMSDHGDAHRRAAYAGGRNAVIRREARRWRGMTATTETVREQGFLPLECDVPNGLTLREWRARRRRHPGRLRRRRLLRRR
jgi:hypothetical protein